NLTRLQPNGAVDTTFDQNVFVDAAVNVVVVQDDGKILIGGGFANVNFALRRNVARLNGDGALDSDFDACVASTAGSGATALAWQRDGKILAGGRFTFANGVARDGIARLNTCGDIDLSFNPQP